MSKVPAPPQLIRPLSASIVLDDSRLSTPHTLGHLRRVVVEPSHAKRMVSFKSSLSETEDRKRIQQLERIDQLRSLGVGDEIKLPQVRTTIPVFHQRQLCLVEILLTDNSSLSSVTRALARVLFWKESQAFPFQLAVSCAHALPLK